MISCYHMFSSICELRILRWDCSCAQSRQSMYKSARWQSLHFKYLKKWSTHNQTGPRTCGILSSYMYKLEDRFCITRFSLEQVSCQCAHETQFGDQYSTHKAELFWRQVSDDNVFCICFWRQCIPFMVDCLQSSLSTFCIHISKFP